MSYASGDFYQINHLNLDCDDLIGTFIYYYTEYYPCDVDRIDVEEIAYSLVGYLYSEYGLTKFIGNLYFLSEAWDDELVYSEFVDMVNRQLITLKRNLYELCISVNKLEWDIDIIYTSCTLSLSFSKLTGDE